jgi:hypothetical protein
METINEEMMKISKTVFDNLRDNSLMLHCLLNGGVDNWDGWDWAIEEYHKLIGERE